MKKKSILLFIFLGMLSLGAYAGPFGLTAGMSYKEVYNACNGNICPVKNTKDTYYIRPVKTHPNFTTYIVYINPKVGLYKITAKSEIINYNDYGDEIKSVFNQLKGRLDFVYGNGVYYNIYKNDVYSYRKDPKYFYSNIYYGEQEVYAKWTPKEDRLNKIILEIKSSSYHEGYIILEYYFDNYMTAYSNEDSVL